MSAKRKAKPTPVSSANAKPAQMMAYKGDEALTIEWWPIDKLTPYGKNPRKPSDRAVSKVAASLKEFGWRQPIVVDAEGVIVVAALENGRRARCIELSPGYCDVIVERLRKQQPENRVVLEGDGRTFEEIAVIRRQPKRAA